MKLFIQTVFILVALLNVALSIDLSSSNIHTVTNETRYTSLHPNVILIPFEKAYHVKGNVILSTGERIEGDHLILTHADEAQYTRDEDVEVLLKYPAYPNNASIYTLTYIQVYVGLTSDETSAYFIGKAGGIGQRFCDILLACNQTHNYGYQIYLYGY
uniref:Uncharacterized protein n=1 Tax=Glossina brevipalpis TaxID=37001 RepID=A0A1A9WAR4_9MUSC